MLRREWILVASLLGSTLGVGAQGITAVTRRTFMGGIAGGGYGFGGGGVGAVSPQVTAAAATLQPAGPATSGPAATGPGAAIGGVGTGVRLAVGRPPESPEARAAREADAAAAVLAFQQEQARKGLPSAQFALGRRHLLGDGVERNPGVARIWLEAAARNGVVEAREWLARIPAPGAPVPASTPADAAP